MLRKFGVIPRAASGDGLLGLIRALLSFRGRTSGPALASAFFDLYEATDLPARQDFLRELHDHFPQDHEAIKQAIDQWQSNPDEPATRALHAITASPCEQLIQQLNKAPNGLQRLLNMRVDLLATPDQSLGLKALDDAFQDAFSAWFNVGFLELRRIHWESPAALLERIIRYEAVHTIQGWDDLQRRVDPPDRRCYGFFHSQMTDEPLIFVEVALTDQLPSAIDKIIANERPFIDPHAAKCAISYSISNCQDGLRGIPFGNYLIKRVVDLLRAELPQLTTFATLSPVPGFAKWLELAGGSAISSEDDKGRAAKAAEYLVHARTSKGEVANSVARFHLGNGARLEAIHVDADLSPNGIGQSHGIMVNYVYDLGAIEANLLALSEMNTVAASVQVQKLAGPVSRKDKS